MNSLRYHLSRWDIGRKRGQSSDNSPSDAWIFSEKGDLKSSSYSQLFSACGSSSASSASSSTKRTPKSGSISSDLTSEPPSVVEAVDLNSPYAEVRASVPNFDAFDMPQNTVRVWVIGLVLLAASSVINIFLFSHDPPYYITTVLLMIIAWPMGRICERILPNKWGLNPGPFNYKEHALISIFVQQQYVTYPVQVVISLNSFAKVWPTRSNAAFCILYCCSAQMLGLSLAGAFRRIVVYPAAMIWPENLVRTTILTNIHVKWNHVANGWRITRLRFFLLVAIIGAIYHFVERGLLDCLGWFSFAPWISPDNYVVNQMFGTFSGLGMFPVTFSWNTVSGYLKSPLVPPTRVFVNECAGLIILMFFVGSIVHYTNIAWGLYMPFASNFIYDRMGEPYHTVKILTGELKLDVQEYESYSPIYYPTARLVSVCMSLAAATATITHTVLFDSPRILHSIRYDENDIHMRLMRRYKETPYWWFAVLFIISLALVIGVVEGFHVGIPIWVVVVATIVGFIFVLPVSFIAGVTSVTVGTDVFSDTFAGVLSNGSLLTGLGFKTWSFGTVQTATQCLSNFKLGHYMKLRPKLVFSIQVISMLLQVIVQCVLVLFVQTNLPDMCTAHERYGYTCTIPRTYYLSAFSMSVVGWKRLMEAFRHLYNVLWIGILIPALTWLWLKKYPRSWIRVIHWPLFFNSLNQLPPATPYNYSCWIVCGLVFSYWIRRYWFSWWAKYTYTLSAALDFGLGIAQFVAFVVFSAGVYQMPIWWGNHYFKDNIDGRGDPMIKLKDGETFGPNVW